jgi:hypothetical protein
MQAIEKARAEGYRNIFRQATPIAAPERLLDRVCEKHGVERIAGPHCLFLLSGQPGLRGDGRRRHHGLLPHGLPRAASSDAFFIKPLGLDRHPRTHQGHVFGNYEKLVYLSPRTRTIRRWTEVAQDGARLCSASPTRKGVTGYGDLTGETRPLTNPWRCAANPSYRFLNRPDLAAGEAWDMTESYGWKTVMRHPARPQPGNRRQSVATFPNLSSTEGPESKKLFITRKSGWMQASQLATGSKYGKRHARGGRRRSAAKTDSTIRRIAIP